MDERHAYWLAALIDGEGSIIIRPRPSGKLWVSIVIAQNDRRLLEVARERAGCGAIYEGQGPRKTGCQLQIFRQADVRRILEEVGPLLILKREKAVLGLTYLP